MAKATRVPKRGAASRPLVAPRTPDERERGWQRTWKKLGFVPYELPADDSPAGQERDFLTRPRTAEGERERLARIQDECERGFRALGRLGPAVTVFGSARRFMVKQGVFAADELGFGHVTDSPREAVDRVIRALPPAVRERLAPVTGGEPKQRAR